MPTKYSNADMQSVIDGLRKGLANHAQKYPGYVSE